MIKAKYKGQVVYGSWFLLGDSYKLILTDRPAERVNKSAIDYDDLTNVSKRPY